MGSQEVYQEYGQELYFFILKKVKDQDIANDVLQNCFIKVHKNLNQLENDEKVKAWLFQIGRNEIANYFSKEQLYQHAKALNYSKEESVIPEEICCFDRFVEELPKIYREVIELTYLTGKKQEEVAETLNISIANVKARIRRSKAILKEKFLNCCKYEMNTNGKLVGSPNCSSCS